MSKLTKKGAQAVTADLDRLANLFQTEHQALGIPQKIAMDFAYRADLLSDAIEKQAGIDRTAADADPEMIGKEQGGPLEAVDSDEPFMKGEFTQQENRELGDIVESGSMSNSNTIEEPRNPQPGKQAMSYEALGRQASANDLDSVGASVAAAAKASRRHAAALTRLAAQVLNVKAQVLEGKASPEKVARTLRAAKIAFTQASAAEKDESEETQEKVAKLVALAHKVAADEEKKEEKKEESGKPWETKEEPEAKKASHGYNLTA